MAHRGVDMLCLVKRAVKLQYSVTPILYIHATI